MQIMLVFHHQSFTDMHSLVSRLHTNRNIKTDKHMCFVYNPKYIKQCPTYGKVWPDLAW